MICCAVRLANPKSITTAVDHAEFRAALGRMDLGLTDAQLTEVLAAVDTDGNGTIEYGEFVARLEAEWGDPADGPVAAEEPRAGGAPAVWRTQSWESVQNGSPTAGAGASQPPQPSPDPAAEAAVAAAQAAVATAEAEAEVASQRAKEAAAEAAAATAAEAASVAALAQEKRLRSHIEGDVSALRVELEEEEAACGAYRDEAEALRLELQTATGVLKEVRAEAEAQARAQAQEGVATTAEQDETKLLLGRLREENERLRRENDTGVESAVSEVESASRAVEDGLRTELADANRRLLESERRAAAADERARTADASADDFNDIAGTFEAELKEARKQLEAEVSERKMVQVQERVAQERAMQLEERVRELEVSAAAAAELREEDEIAREEAEVAREEREEELRDLEAAHAVAVDGLKVTIAAQGEEIEELRRAQASGGSSLGPAAASWASVNPSSQPAHRAAEARPSVANVPTGPAGRNEQTDALEEGAPVGRAVVRRSFAPEAPGDLELREGEIIMLLKNPPVGVAKDWWKGYAQADELRRGIFPRSHVEEIVDEDQQSAPESPLQASEAAWAEVSDSAEAPAPAPAPAAAAGSADASRNWASGSGDWLSNLSSQLDSLDGLGADDDSTIKGADDDSNPFATSPPPEENLAPTGNEVTT
eukprot:COSAG04_NODE_1250_length_7576_cov_5.772101_2_plen_658_part_00